MHDLNGCVCVSVSIEHHLSSSFFVNEGTHFPVLPFKEPDVDVVAAIADDSHPSFETSKPSSLTLFQYVYALKNSSEVYEAESASGTSLEELQIAGQLPVIPSANVAHSSHGRHLPDPSVADAQYLLESAHAA